jgi:ABC-type glycerol-3-phosphate transport system substrate-binding protein
MKKRIAIRTITRLFIIVTIFVWSFSGNAVSFGDTAASAANEPAAGDSVIRRDETYELYISQFAGAQKPETEVSIAVDQYIEADMDVEVLQDFNGHAGKSLKTDEQGYVTWEVDVPQEGLYNIFIEYYPIEGRSSAIEREIWINGTSPFIDAKHITLTRVWVNAEEVKQDNRGNDLRPRQIEQPRWQTAYFNDYMGYHNEPYLFHFNKGKNIIKLVSVKEPMVIGSMKLTQYKTIPTYKEKLEEYKQKGYEIIDDEPVYLQGESASFKSDPTLYPLNDRTTPATVPYHKSKIRLNTIGGTNWQLPGQWIEWDIPVEKSGLYQITIKGRQNITRGLYANRRITINGEVPFREMEYIPFNYSATWNNFILGDGEEPYLFYLEEGVNKLKMEVVLGDLAEILREAEDSVYVLNNAYRKILMLTGRTPDKYRDYQLEKKLPGVMETLNEQSRILADLSKRLTDYTGQRGSHNGILDRLSYQLADMYKRPRTIQNRMKQFKDNVGALGTWINNTRYQPFEIDYIVVSSPGENLPKADASFFKRILHELSAFFASFTEDYNSVGNVYDEKDAVTVWITTGRDQAQVIKKIIDDSFSPQKGIAVNVELVQANVLLPATVAGRGPDIAMTVGNGEPVNYATRHAAVDLTQFPDLPEVLKEFTDSSILPFRFQGGIYGLPEQQQFLMMFYRKDILDELGVEPPNTWEDLYNVIPVIQKTNMDISVPVVVNNDIWGAMESFSTLLYQEGGKLYNGDGISSALDTEEAIRAFKKWTELYVNYKFPVEFDVANRFRTGEIPLALNEYWLYNSLQVFAPELRGMWEMAPIPGVMREDGVVDRSTTSGGYAVMMLEQAKDKEAAWEFMKWWVSADTQVRFGREMESLMGASARHPTANIEAAKRLPWPVKDYNALAEQRQWVIGNPEVPGGYFTPRHLNNAFRKVTINGEDPRETLLDYVRIINEEIDNKRKEFGLELRDGGK